MKLHSLALGVVLVGLTPGFGAARAEVVRHPIPNSTFPIAPAVPFSGNVTTYYVRGQLPPVVNMDANPPSPPDARAA